MFACERGRLLLFFFFFQAEDGIRDIGVTGVQTCALPISRAPWLTQGYLRDPANSEKLWLGGWLHTGDIGVIGADGYLKRSEERRGGKEGRSRWSPYH